MTTAGVVDVVTADVTTAFCTRRSSGISLIRDCFATVDVTLDAVGADVINVDAITVMVDGCGVLFFCLSACAGL